MDIRNDDLRPGLTMDGPSTYRIRVRGRLGADSSDRLEGMNITYASRADGTDLTVLVGRLADQGALTGVLNTLYAMHLPVLSVECLEIG